MFEQCARASEFAPLTDAEANAAEAAYRETFEARCPPTGAVSSRVPEKASDESILLSCRPLGRASTSPRER